ncbi:MAG: glycosyltransferase [Proteobacteria bacterium]|nr:glycosyltransferase [Pseudomonadota bacterium]MDA1356560.1 glycosyltransferase [Pseudomonadota bacterium]
MSQNGSSRILIYSHDTFGLGHLRRCRAIAHHLVEQNKQLTVLILSGSPIIGSFDFRTRVDFVRVPGVIKLRNGEYTSLSLHMDIEDTLRLRSSIIKHTASIFDPDVFIVDKEPIGLRGEVKETLEMLKERGTRLILGLRDVMDEPKLLAAEWRSKNVRPVVEDLYDEIWIYGLPQICNPLENLGLSEKTQRKTIYTGYLPRQVGTAPILPNLDIVKRPFLLATTGGGGDGEELMDWVLSAYESDPLLPYPVLLVLGPFMQPEARARFAERADKLERVETITFDPHLESLMTHAAGVVAMGGYNTFCEILSFNKRALIVPREKPRLEQRIRAVRAQELGLVQVLINDNKRDPAKMAAALRAMPKQKLPSEVVVPGLMEGLFNVNRLMTPWLYRASEPDADAKTVHNLMDEA